VSSGCTWRSRRRKTLAISSGGRGSGSVQSTIGGSSGKTRPQSAASRIANCTPARCAPQGRRLVGSDTRVYEHAKDAPCMPNTTTRDALSTAMLLCAATKQQNGCVRELEGMASMVRATSIRTIDGLTQCNGLCDDTARRRGDEATRASELIGEIRRSHTHFDMRVPAVLVATNGAASIAWAPKGEKRHITTTTNPCCDLASGTFAL